MGNTRDTGYLQNIVQYDASNNITLPANLTVTGTITGYATTSYVGTQLGGYVPTTRTISINGTSLDLSANRSFTINSMVYPGAGIAVSTGSAWGTSLTDNSSNWNTAFGWGNHAGLYSLLNHTHTFASLTSKPTTLVGYGITDAATSAQGTSADTAYGWGNHAIVGYLTGITSGQVTTALGFTPYNATNPTGYITSAALSTYATESYVGTQIANLVASSPAALDTLNELAVALGNDAAFSTTVSTALGNRLRVDINTQGLSATLQGYGRTNLGLGTAATSNTGDFVAYRTFGTAANSATGDFVAYRTFGTAANNNTGDFALASHTHSIANVTGLQTALDGKQASGSYAASVHTHIISDVTGLQTALDGKQASLGYTPYNSTNPSGYISSYTETDTLQSVILRNAATNTGFTIENGNSTYSTPASTNVPLIYIHNTSTNANGHAILALRSMGPSGGDPFLSLDIDGVIGWHVGVDNSDGDTFKIGKSWATVGDNTYLSITTSGNTTFGGTIAATNFSGTHSGSSSGTNTGDQTNISGNAATATNVAYSGLTGTVPTWNQNTTGTAANSTLWNGAGYSYTATSTVNSYILGLSANGDWRPMTTAAIQSWLGLGSLAYSSATIPTNNNQLTNGAGYITGYTETDTLASVTGRGASTSTALSINNTLTVTNGRLTVRTGGANTYGIVSGYDNNNHMMTFRADVTGPTASPTYTAGHQMTFIEYAQAGDTTGWFFKSSSSTNYEEIARITRAGATFSGTISASNFSGSHSGTSSGTNTGDQSYVASAGKILGYQRGSFTVGGNTNTFYPVAFQIGSTATGEQGISVLQIERGGYDEPGYSNYTFSTFHCRIRAKADGWGYGASYVQVEANAYTTPMLAEVAQQNQTSQLIVWLRGGCAYRWMDIEGSWTLNFGNSSGTSYSTYSGNVVYASTTTNSIGSNFKYQTGWGDNFISGRLTASSANLGSITATTRTLNVAYSIGVRANLTGTEQEIFNVGNTGSGVNDGYMRLLDSGTVKVLIGANNARSGDTYFNGGGNFGIHTDTPNAKLQVVGRSNFTSGGRTVSIGDGNYANHILCDSNVDFAFNYNNGSTGGFGFFGGTSSAKFMCSSGGTLTVSGDVVAYGSPSDARLKDIKEKVPNALNSILKLNGYRFDWKEKELDIYGDDKKILHIKEDIGVIAQEVADVLPELAKTNEDGFMSVRYQGLTAVLIEAVKEQQTQIESQKSEIEELKDLVQQLINR